MDIKLYEEFVNNYVIGNLTSEFDGISPEETVLIHALDYTTGSEETLVKVKYNDTIYNIPKNQIYIDPSMSI